MSSSSHPSLPPPTTTTDIDHDLGDQKNHLRVGPQPPPSNGNAETPVTMSEQSSIRLADEKQRQQDDKTAEEGLSGGDNNATQAALPISQLIFIVVALVLGIFMVCCRS